MDLIRAQLKNWFETIKEKPLSNNIEVHFEDGIFKSEVAIIGKKYAGSIELGKTGVCDLSIIDINNNEIIEFRTTTFSDENELFSTLNAFISKIV